MGALMKIVILTAPVLALVFYYVISRQGQMDVEMKKDTATFERDWNEFNEEFHGAKSAQQKYRARAEQAEKELEAIKKKEKEEELKAAKFKQEFEKAMEEVEEADKDKAQKK